MKKRKTLFILLVITGTLFLLPNFYNNSWKAVEPAYYDEWQIRYDRLVMARLVKNRQDGFFSAGGLLGLGDLESCAYCSATHRHQYNTFISNEIFKTYKVYKSNPGSQGVLYGVVDNFLDIPGEQKLLLFRGITSLVSALFFGIIFAYMALEFGILAGAAMLLYSAFTAWIVLPAGSIFSNLWAFYLPFIVCSYMLINAATRNHYNSFKIQISLFVAVLLKTLLSGLDLITTVLVMTTVPIFYFGIYKQWGLKTIIERFVKISIAISVATATSLIIMSFQISRTNEPLSSAFSRNDSSIDAFSYIKNRFGHHFAGNSNFFLSGEIESTKIGLVEIISKYISTPTINVPWPGDDLQILHWHLIIIFVFFTVLYFFFKKKRIRDNRKAIALIIATWYSILAPLSWIIIFRPHSIIHTHYNPIAWQMPFMLLGFALCGFVITELFKNKTT